MAEDPTEELPSQASKPIAEKSVEVTGDGTLKVRILVSQNHFAKCVSEWSCLLTFLLW